MATYALLQHLDDPVCLQQNPVLHRLFPQAKVPQSHQAKASLLSPAGAVVGQHHTRSMNCTNMCLLFTKL